MLVPNCSQTHFVLKKNIKKSEVKGALADEGGIA